ncbi:MAG: hypothetical protein ABIG44_08100 [Planctomycetota bacterium]
MSWSPHSLRKRMKVEEAFGPPLTPEELTGNLSQFEHRLNREMRCPAGRNQVYVRSLLTGTSTTRPRIALKCPLRRDIGQTPDVFYEHIRDVCCGDHEQCPAWQAMKERHVQT